MIHSVERTVNRGRRPAGAASLDIRGGDGARQHELIRRGLGESDLYPEDLRRKVAEAPSESGNRIPAHLFRPNFQWKRDKGEMSLEKSINRNENVLKIVLSSNDTGGLF